MSQPDPVPDPVPDAENHDVENHDASTVHILMCPPQYFGIEYEINPWMNREREVDHDVAITQWEALRDILNSLGAAIDLVDPQPGLPDLVFTANAAMMFERRAVLSRFRHSQRQGEERHFHASLETLGFDVLELPDGFFFEGAGDALFCGKTLYGGYRIRSVARSLQAVAKLVDREVIPLELIDSRFYHLDTCFCPINAETAIWFPDAFDEYGQQVLRSRIPDLITLNEVEAIEFAANAVVVGQHVVTNSGCPQLALELRSRGLEPIDTPLSEFVKAGGSAKCLTLRLDGEDAAA
ncbi:MAG: amidinotransferase [Rhodopirellula sp.]|nr:amidinotransferase [Rhodopirellula sp.]